MVLFAKAKQIGNNFCGVNKKRIFLKIKRFRDKKLAF